MKWVQLWFLKRPPAEKDALVFDRAQAVLVAYPKTLETWVRRLQKKGVKVLPYVSFYKAPSLADVPETEGWEGGSPAKSEVMANPFWRAVATDDHPDWIARDEKGKFRRPFDNDGYLKGWNQTCPLVESYREACKRGIRALLADGYDGIYVDNLHFSGRLPHVGKGGGEAVGRAAESLAVDAVRAIRGTSAKAIVAVNGGMPAMKKLVDMYVWESFFFSWARDLSIFTDESWKTIWEEIRAQAWEPGTGAQPIACPYLGFSGRSLREDAFSYLAVALILGMALSDFGTATDPSAVGKFARRNLFQGGLDSAVMFEATPSQEEWHNDFYGLELGDACSGIIDQDGCVLRRFDKGTCVFNPTKALIRMELEGWQGSAREIACGLDVRVRDGVVRLWLPPFTGRILVRH